MMNGRWTVDDGGSGEMVGWLDGYKSTTSQLGMATGWKGVGDATSCHA